LRKLKKKKGANKGGKRAKGGEAPGAGAGAPGEV